VHIDRIVEKAGVFFALCRQVGDVPGLPLELPLWMFDHLACTSIRRRRSPEVDLATLSALQFLLGEVLRPNTFDHHLPSADPDLSADLMSCDQNQGDVDEPPSHKTGSIRTVRSVRKNVSVTDAALAELASPDTPQDHMSDDAVADGTQHKPRHRIGRRSPQSASQRGE
jgi:hypothetical protein